MVEVMFEVLYLTGSQAVMVHCDVSGFYVLCVLQVPWVHVLAVLGVWGTSTKWFPSQWSCWKDCLCRFQSQMGQFGFSQTLSFKLAVWAAKLASKSCNAMDLRQGGRLFHALATL